MEIVNGILLILALSFVWAAVNLERPAASRVEINQSDQLNESMNFLKRLKKPSAKEESYSRRLSAYKSTMDNIISEIPETMQQIEDSYERNCHGSNRKVRQLDHLVNKITTTVQDSNKKHDNDQQQAIRKLTELSSKISELNNSISPLEGKVNQNRESLELLTNDARKVKESVGF